ncbi:MAG TPA: alcohol dehydrogenase catalytic domain-containing protein [Vicinamibacteria bacterium]|jgi:L-iditol 2-dehydrogenase
MRVARLHGREDLRLHDEDKPRPGPGEVLVRVGAVGVCGSDIHWFAEGGIGEARVRRPFVLGHEFGGTTEDGRRVAVDPAIPCEACPSCVAGHANLCPSVRYAGDGAHDGGLGEWIAWPERCLVPLPDPLTEADGAMLEPLGIAIHALDLAHLRLGARVGVFGCGPIGLLLVQLARLGGARVFATDLAGRPHRLEAARALGAEVFAADDGREGGAIRDAAGSGGLDVGLETAGEQAAVDAAVEAVRPGARVVLVGIPVEARTSFVASSARRKGLTLVMARRMGDVYARAVQLVASGRVDVRSLVTHRFPLAEIRAAFDLAVARTGLKVIVEP